MSFKVNALTGQLDVVVDDIQNIKGGAALSKYPQLEAFPGIIAFWDFSEARAPYYSKVGKGLFPLRNAPGSRVKKTTNGPTGNALLFNGTSDYLIIPEDEVGTGPLNIGGNGGSEVCVIAIARAQQGSGIGYLAGPWLEDDNGPKRQYGLFWNLGTYGGSTRACFHISRFGGASPNIPYSRDYAANGYEEVRSNIFQCYAGTYDGSQIKAYIDGRFEPYTNYTEPGGPTGEGLTYDKNPYNFTLGLNTVPCEFTVGANKITTGYSNFWNGEISCILVMDRAPERDELCKIQQAMLNAASGIKVACSRSGSAAGVASLGFKCYATTLGSDRSTETSNTNSFTVTSGGSSPNINYYLLSGASTTQKFLFTDNGPLGFTTENLNQMKWDMQTSVIGEGVRAMIRIGSTWYASEQVFTNSVAAPTGNDWSTTSEIKILTFDPAAANWRDFTFNPGTAMTLAGAARSQPLPTGDITAFGLYHASGTTGSIRIRQFELITL